ncbi:probable G-protein coupled receptor 33 [Protopterus annectens]|uniref:probable G-protein coupled receptor 33 n=1 Tax=Protopterus annectens TaxID=7888 RepID=UPI001CFB56B1|nr:probable G-protein coupled receptor 33 [Protopterus annectens]
MTTSNNTDLPSNESLMHPKDPMAAAVTMAVMLLIVFLFGTTINGVGIWVLAFKMKKTLNTKWYLQLLLTYLFFTFTIPFWALQLIMDSQWYFGRIMCKLLNTLLSVCMFASVFFLMAIAVDRCLLVVQPVWCKNYRTTKLCTLISITIWILALIASSPYLVFRDIFQDENKTICANNYAVSNDWDSADGQNSRIRIHMTMFITRLLFSFIIPFSVIALSYIIITFKIKQKNFLKSRKSFHVFATAVLSFFFCWLPYHVYSYLIIYHKTVPKRVLIIMRVLTLTFVCTNCCITPVLYVTIGEKFKALFKKSIFSLFENAFHEDTACTVSSNDNKSDIPSSCDKARQQEQQQTKCVCQLLPTNT